MTITRQVGDILRALWGWADVMPDDVIREARRRGANPVSALMRDGEVTRDEVREAAADWLCAQCVEPVARSPTVVCGQCWEEREATIRPSPVAIPLRVKRQIKSMAVVRTSRVGEGDVAKNVEKKKKSVAVQVVTTWSNQAVKKFVADVLKDSAALEESGAFVVKQVQVNDFTQ